jgi:hypothetical protein
MGDNMMGQVGEIRETDTEEIESEVEAEDRRRWKKERVKKTASANHPAAPPLPYT